MLCNGRTRRKVCYTYDGDGNLIKEYSPIDNGLTTYQYTVEDRLEAVYTGNTYNRNLQIAAAYDGDGNRVYQVNYNPEKDEDFSCYYDSYDNCDYNGTGIQLRVTGEVSPTEEELIKLIAPAGAVLTSKYELIEYINDVNREYAEVLVEQNINGRTDTTYTYGVYRISRELFNQTCRTSYYLYDPRGSVAGLADGEGHLTKTYRYSVTGELTYGSADHENEYTYNGESYNPNIHSQYLRARYYDVVTANFLTEDSYLGNINEPLTLNRYNYCISSYLNYVDPSGNENIFISGSDKKEEDSKTYKYRFIETALHDIDEFLKNGLGSPDSITWMVFTGGYTVADIENFKNTADKLGIHFVGIKDRAEFVNYINYKNIEECNSDDRESDLITYVSVFSHGQTPRYSGGKETQLSFRYGTKEPDTVNFKTSDIALLDPNAFDHTKTAFYACNVGTDDDFGTNFAQEWTNLTNGRSIAIQYGRSDYTYINHSGMNSSFNVVISIPGVFAVSLSDVVEKGKEAVNKLLGRQLFQPSDEWQEKMERKKERQSKINETDKKTKGYSDKGSLSYPVLTNLFSDKDIIFDPEFGLKRKIRGWKIYEPQ